MLFFQGPQPYEVEAGDTATFRCNAVADTDLDLAINWLKDGRRIDFDSEPRFIQTNDNSLTITKTTELDSGRVDSPYFPDILEGQEKWKENTTLGQKPISATLGHNPVSKLLLTQDCKQNQNL